MFSELTPGITTAKTIPISNQINLQQYLYQSSTCLRYTFLIGCLQIYGTMDSGATVIHQLVPRFEAGICDSTLKYSETMTTDELWLETVMQSRRAIQVMLESWENMVHIFRHGTWPVGTDLT